MSDKTPKTKSIVITGSAFNGICQRAQQRSASAVRREQDTLKQTRRRREEEVAQRKADAKAIAARKAGQVPMSDLDIVSHSQNNAHMCTK